MAKAKIDPGICGLKTTVEAKPTGNGSMGSPVNVTIESECAAIRRLGENLPELDPFREFTFRGEGPLTLEKGGQYCSHASCPVPAAIIKVVEVAAQLALPADVKIEFVDDTD